MTKITGCVSYPGFKDLPIDLAVEYLSKALENVKKLQVGQNKLNAAIAQPAVHSLGKGKVVGSSPTRSSKKSKQRR